MSCRITDNAALAVWPALCEFRRQLRDDPLAARDRYAFVLRDGTWVLEHEDLARADAVLFVLLGEDAQGELLPGVEACSSFKLHRHLRGDAAFEDHGVGIDDDARAVFRLYLPLVLGAWRASLAGRSFVTAHIAQTLDGRIACLNGHSQWISNEANLHHSHRLRALHDGVLVGRRTVENDDPQLTVRHVPGRDPVRVVLSGSGSVLRDPRNFRVLSGAGSLVLCERAKTNDLDAVPDEVQLLPLESDSADGGLGADTICNALKEREVGSLFVEGGGRTLSSFISAGRIDVLHVHIAPRILGSGVSSFELPAVSRIQDGHALHMEHFNLDGELLLECRAPEALGTHG